MNDPQIWPTVWESNVGAGAEGVGWAEEGKRGKTGTAVID